MATVAEERRSTTTISLEVQREIEQFLYEEADILDSWRFRDWLTLFSQDTHYWAPVRENRFYRERDKEQSEPGTSAFFDETFEELSQRVERLYTHMAWAEDPPSRTRHLITNIRVRETEKPDEFDVESSFYIHRTRTERDHDWIVGKRFDIIRRSSENGYGFEIARRTIIFDVAILIIKNLSLFY